METVGWAYENWLQENYGIEEEVIEQEDEEEEEIEAFDVDDLKPGVNLLKIKTADWKVIANNLLEFKIFSYNSDRIHSQLSSPLVYYYNE